MLNIRKNNKAGLASAATTPPTAPTDVQQHADRPGERNSTSIIGSDMIIIGNLISRGKLQIDGEIEGDIHGISIVVSETAKVTGVIIADEIVVRGHAMGSIRGKSIMLQSSSHVEGDLFHQTLSIEQGAIFEGKSRRSDDPTAVTDGT
ncbi:MAG: cytoskeletal protein CcmA (bactofilin family) [Hyphomicrobiaceae bacterium]|jgi:cytoskeletal protein CcmA (bactofilin family)